MDLAGVELVTALMGDLGPLGTGVVQVILLLRLLARVDALEARFAGWMGGRRAATGGLDDE